MLLLWVIRCSCETTAAQRRLRRETRERVYQPDRYNAGRYPIFLPPLAVAAAPHSGKRERDGSVTVFEFAISVLTDIIEDYPAVDLPQDIVCARFVHT